MKIRLSYENPTSTERHYIVEFITEEIIQYLGTLQGIEGMWVPFIRAVPLEDLFIINEVRLGKHGRFILEFKEEKTAISEVVEQIEKASKDTEISLHHSIEHKLVTPDFWDYLIERADDTDHYWLSNWLEEGLEYYKETSPCPVCSSKRRYKKGIRSKSGKWTLETHEKCKNCKHQLSSEDHRPELRKALQLGNILEKDVKTLEKDLEGK